MRLPTPSRWAVLVGVIFLEVIGGSPYAFAVYAPQLQSLFAWPNAAIAAVGGIGNVGLYLALDAGFFFDARGPAATALGGALLSLLGYAPPQALVALASFTLNHGAGWLDTAAVSTAVRAFPRDRGFVVGLLKSFFGLSASLLTLSYSSLFRPNAVAYLFFLTALVPGVAALAAALLRVLPAAEAAAPLTAFERRKLSASALGLVALAAYVALVGVLQSRGVLGAQPLLAGLLLPLLLAQALLALPEPAARTASERSPLRDGDGDCDGDGDGEGEGEGEGEDGQELALAPTAARVNAEGGEALPEAKSGAAASEGGGGGGGASLVAGLLSVYMLLFCFVLFAGTGAGLTLINNLGALTKALGADKDGQDVYVIVLSVSNCIGRLAVGAFSDAFAKRVSRPWMLCACVIVMASAQLVMSFATLGNGLLFVGVGVTGAAYGSFWSLGPSLVADRFGTRCFASLYNVTSLWTALASYLFSGVMAGAFYAAAASGSGGASSADCSGSICFRNTFLVLSGLCALAALAAAVLAVRLRDLYVPETGVARSFSEWARRNPAQATSRFARASSRACTPLCCCAFGRALVFDGEDDDEAGAGGAGSARVSKAFDGDVSMAFLGDDLHDSDNRRSVVSTRSGY